MICDHRKRWGKCRLCFPDRFCEHGKRKDCCDRCTPSLICTHNLKKRYCLFCNSGEMCLHGKTRRSCITCNPEKWAKEQIRQISKKSMERGYTPPTINPQELLNMRGSPNCFACEQPLIWPDVYTQGLSPVLHHNHISGEVYGYTHPNCNIAEGFISSIVKSGHLKTFLKNMFNVEIT